ncbi:MULTISPECIES: bifunctional phosphopantothenoylcysteine decarboxylase/phosphopantothenate--cysteine ligase CoaBC [Subtercola]|uniref:Coenzyme A biosynthesis bifunctional protein CoaBC n=1 Tax=Subtercola vilae TaxID=2056433 RepID=A0A4T2C2P4_9MICO|nr:MULTISPECIES: bifunctional phosphopantothenoylcysteine decarboxylase/phosphopantothenate--cysteine ligase CoaBC [Subtercola]MEA9985098.1 bifunctional phosphopantothenoylcysteine decarboxylase/phosphopantothenate--cysteine ligase CoaBC [Subtercola sp. RTI3]TIH37702.1 bifunctional phosphopantothenoylcysteine decarboxylase/phosphopantothenate--cysteine ligase CoaBC [Subtercola vilae]
MNIVVGITGGIAAYKAVSVIRGFVLAGHSVQVIATEHALRFVGKPTLEAISRNTVHTDLYEGVAEVRHVAIGQAADLIVIAPTTANSLAKLAAGIADDLLGNTILASRAPILLAPAMHTEMWQNPATVANVATLRSRGFHFIGPDSGQLTGADSGPGRLSEPDAIVAAGLALVATVVDGREPADASSAGSGVAAAGSSLAGLRILISAGGTREPLDPVRFIGNRSSGKQGVALADAAIAEGARVTFVGAHLEVPPPRGAELHSVETAEELRVEMLALQGGADIIIMAAAVADYRPSEVAEGKIKKDVAGDVLTLELVKNADILAELSSQRADDQVIVGFAAETAATRDELLELGQAKIARKGCDYLVLNRVGWSEGFTTDHNTVVLLDRTGHIVIEAAGSKLSVAHSILSALAVPSRTHAHPNHQEKNV